ncbi:hypothetical protein MVEN_00558300 [Mycena venus]|uniref:F-box domain-containing protein n=1 Tax=Mycena venus TaxID=2733690 RepID=A0A8H7D4P0_9AGAR|nr:hypothetical protein MVEN_00558300 [Mycena venus]
MHRTFHIPELLHLIFAQVQSPYQQNEDFNRRALNKNLGRQDFAALARTCKTFQGPALDFLWREQETLTNLLRCLPTHLWEEEFVDRPVFQRRRPKRILRITDGPIQPADWDIPLAYALRIQRLRLRWWEFDDYMDEEFSAQDVFEKISSGLPRHHLCPNLTGLVFHFNQDSLFPHIRLFLGPKVVDATIQLPTNSSHTTSLHVLPIRYPQLKTLRVSTYSPQAEPLYSDILSKIVLSLDRIEDLSLDKLDGVAIEHLSQLPGLKSLNVSELLDWNTSPLARSIMDRQNPPFPTLRDLFLGDTTIELAIELLNLLPDCCLLNFHVGTAVSVTNLITRQLYAALASQLSHFALQSLHIELSEDREMPAPPEHLLPNYVINGHVLAALFCFTNLTEVSLAPPVGFDIDDATAWDMARAWPKLIGLHLVAATDLHHPSSLSLRGLRAFAKHCRELSSLTITFNASTPFNDSSEIMILPQTSLTSLDVGTSPITDPSDVAQFMSGLFPTIVYIPTQDEWRWDDVVDDDIVAFVGEEVAAYDQFTRWKRVEEMLRKSRDASKVLDVDAL